MEKPLVSVVVPIYNMEPFLNQTIDSILKSTYANIEIILFDDESTDNSFAIAQTYADKYPFIRTFKHSNAGASATRNAAIREANADYILPVDADNLISENYIEDAVNVLITNPQINVVSCDALFLG